MALAIPKVLLIVLSLAGFWTLWAFPYQNGLLKILGEQTKPGAVLPGPTPAPMKQAYTGVATVDRQLTVLVSFFYTAIDGNRADISLSFLGLGGQVLGAWTLITIESLRVAHRGKFLLTATTLLGLGVAVVGYACVAPLWFALHLWVSPTVVNPKDYQLIVDTPVKLALAPVSILIGFGIPSIIMTLPAPSVLSFETKQTWTGIQQGWPIWIGLTQFVLSTTAIILDQRATILTEKDKRAKTIKYLRRAYAFSILSSTGSYLGGLGLSGLAFAFPTLFSPVYTPQLQPRQIYWPINPFSSHQARALAEGALWFLQWDLIIAVASNLVWGLSLRAASERKKSGLSQVIVGTLKTVLITLLLGPTATATVALWARDERVFRQSGGSAEAGQQH